MNEIQVFESERFGSIRGTILDGEPWLVGKDVAAALGYSNASKAVMDHVDDEDKRFEMLRVSDSQNGNLVKTAIINESGLYSLILSSKLPTAKAFKHWVTSEVLPSIRRHGAYVTPETLDRMIASPEFGIRLLTEIKKEREARQALEAEMEKARPKVLFADAVSMSDSAILVGELAKLLKQNGVKDMGQNRLFRWMRENGWLIRRKGTDYNMPTQRAMELGLFRVKETAISHSDGHVTVSRTAKVTGKGQTYFVNLFLADKTPDT